jgi:nucleotide-binding universal stress UspA family protein
MLVRTDPPATGPNVLEIIGIIGIICLYDVYGEWTALGKRVQGLCSVRGVDADNEGMETEGLQEVKTEQVAAAENVAKQTDATWVVGIDGSENSIRALKCAASLAPDRASTLHIVRAWTYAALGGLDVTAPVALEDMRPSVAFETVDEFTGEMKLLGVRVESDVVYGSSAAVLLDASAKADLLVVGSRGHGGFARLLLGSTSHQCATHAKVPVLVVPKDAAVGEPLTEITVGMDASAGAKSALAWAFEFAGDDVSIRALGAWHPGWLSADLYAWEVEEKRARKEFDQAIDEVEQTANRQGAVLREFVTGHPGQILLDESPSTGLLVVGERGQRGLKAALLGSVTTEVLHRATCPVVVVPVAD